MAHIELESRGSAAPSPSVFVDDSGAKRRRARRVGRLVGLGLIVYSLLLLAGVVLPVPFSGARLPPAAQDGPVRVRTVPSIPETVDGEQVLVGRAPVAPRFAAAALAGTEGASGGTMVPGPPAIGEPPPLPAPPPPPAAPAAAPSPTVSEPSGDAVVAGRSDRAPRSHVATTHRAAPSGGSERSSASPPAGVARRPAPPAEPGPNRTTGR